MTMWMLLFCIIYIPTCLCSSSSSREDKDKRDKRDYVLTELLEFIEGQNDEIYDLKADLKRTLKLVTGLKDQIDNLKMELNDASIIPPNLALNFAICAGRLPGISSGEPGDKLRCPANSVDLLGPGGENDIVGTGLVGPIGEGRDGEDEFTMIEQCEAACLHNDLCFSFNWFYQISLGGREAANRCELYGDQDDDHRGGGGLAPNQEFIPDGDTPLIFCRIEKPPCDIGNIITFSGSDDPDDLPEGYISLADGSSISNIDYPDLCKKLGTTFGENYCDLPDPRNKFIIGAGDTASLGDCSGDDTLDVY